MGRPRLCDRPIGRSSDAQTSPTSGFRSFPITSYRYNQSRFATSGDPHENTPHNTQRRQNDSAANSNVQTYATPASSVTSFALTSDNYNQSRSATYEYRHANTPRNNHTILDYTGFFLLHPDYNAQHLLTL
ncbi:hypothetical protein QVD17_07040 [Tagetes erecta]|uniref:Uncharacterized protein n=1 Tax=Tagetes erecta TaxID=13708 RepID=A0AAD8PCC0_TARER|nr:hypothetical protein QVD17_07040 [Tagetes erecta]